MKSGLKNRFRPWSIVWLTVLWMGLQGQFNWANFFAGFTIALLIIFGLPLPAMPVHGLRLNWLPFFRLMGSWVVSLMMASVKVAWLALRPQAPPKTSIVQVPMRVQSELVLAFGTVLFNLQPGGSVSDIDIANRMWTIHLLDTDNEEALAREIAGVATLERRLIDTFERS
ncbi:Na+/H+ antiporter subunit E [Corynebacterium sp. A21]|uniref:Na+/H+ antiporter subunit E n=1 Tax=Corynebacterium sp. A21 TaxID=3457318 RepID=UPI003FD58C14